MADLESQPDSERCKRNADGSTAFNDKQQTIDFYKSWSQKYDEDFRPEHYVGPRLTAEALGEFIPSDEQRKKVEILDIAAGTGLVGYELAKLGFTTIDAVDGCEDMLQLLHKKKTYRKASKVLFGSGPVSVPDESYDVVTSCGGFVPGHLPVETVDEIIRMCKRGGLAVIVMRDAFLQEEEYTGLEQKMVDCEKAGLWKLLKRNVTPNYFLDKEGITFVFQKL